MEIKTASGIETVNKRDPYGKWLIGYTQSESWTGHATIQATWNNYSRKKPKNCSWTAWGYICGQYINPLYNALKERKETLKAVKEDMDELLPILAEKGIELPSGSYIRDIEPFI